MEFSRVCFYLKEIFYTEEYCRNAHRNFEAEEECLLAARKRAFRMANGRVLRLFEPEEFEKKQPFPNLEILHLTFMSFPCPGPDTEGIREDILSIFRKHDNIGLSDKFYSLFLEKTSSLTSLSLLSMFIIRAFVVFMYTVAYRIW